MSRKLITKTGMPQSSYLPCILNSNSSEGMFRSQTSVLFLSTYSSCSAEVLLQPGSRLVRFRIYLPSIHTCVSDISVGCTCTYDSFKISSFSSSVGPGSRRKTVRPRTNVVTPDVCSLGSAYSNAHLRSARIPPLSTAVSESASASASSRARARGAYASYVHFAHARAACGRQRARCGFVFARAGRRRRPRPRPSSIQCLCRWRRLPRRHLFPRCCNERRSNERARKCCPTQGMIHVPLIVPRPLSPRRGGSGVLPVTVQPARNNFQFKVGVPQRDFWRGVCMKMSSCLLLHPATATRRARAPPPPPTTTPP